MHIHLYLLELFEGFRIEKNCMFENVFEIQNLKFFIKHFAM